MRNGNALLAHGQFDDAYAVYAGLHGRFGADGLMAEGRFQKGMSLLAAQQYDQALAVFKAIPHRTGVNDAVNETHYQKARSLFAAGDYVAAKDLFTTIAAYKDAQQYLGTWQEQQYQKAQRQLANKHAPEALVAFRAISGYKDSQTQIDQIRYDEALSLMNAGGYPQAQKIWEQIANYRDSATWLKESKYQQALAAKPPYHPLTTDDPEYNLNRLAFAERSSSYRIFRELRGYKDVDALLADFYFLHELIGAKWASADGAFSLELGEPGEASFKNSAGGPVYGQLIFRDFTRTYVFTVTFVDANTIRVTVTGVTATLQRKEG